MIFNENSRVKIPAILHLCSLGYEYITLKQTNIDTATNIFKDIFNNSISKINPALGNEELKKIFEEINDLLNYEDLGEAFYKRLTSSSKYKLIDFENFNNNSFNVVTELTYKNGEDEFRPDITILINGMPIAFIEVKKPNNQNGIVAERDRINMRFKNKKFRKFINITQLLVFSNNMDYLNDSIEPIQGAFYSSTSYDKAIFNYFREEETDLNKNLIQITDNIENVVLNDNNLISIKNSEEFITNKSIKTPTNQILTSLFCKERIAMLLKYSLAYVRTNKGIEKHIMRYPQLFATKAISKTLDKDIKKGIIWHTQGSGKTALAFYNVKYLTDYFQQKNIIPKFYFIVDRIDLMNQAIKEFSSRGLNVKTVNSKEELLKIFKLNQAIDNFDGEAEITVVNIQKFQNDTTVLNTNDYNIKVQRIYFLDEVHRSYNPTGCFLSNLINSDRNAIMIGLTGTPLILKDRKSTEIFGNYIHKYYYNSSISDGYTLKLIREGIETSYKMKLDEALKKIEVLDNAISKETLYSHEKFVEPMLDYIIDDFIHSKIRFGDNTIGAMVVCDSSQQAKKLYEIFNKKYAFEKKVSASLILHDIGDKDERKEDVENFKDGNIDILFVYNMLLTGFDAHRLKKLYIARIIKDHNLLQTLTRVNRPYKNFKYGYVVDFADIRKEFDLTNKAYFDELQSELGDEIKNYSNIFKSKEETEKELDEIREKLFIYDLKNAEIFSQQINKILDKKQISDIKRALENMKTLYNICKISNYNDILEKVDYEKINILYNEVTRHLDLLNLKDAIENNFETQNLINLALEDIIFNFRKISEAELILAGELKDILRKTRETLQKNVDIKDPEYISLYEALKILFQKKNLDEINQEEMKNNIIYLEEIHKKIVALNLKNEFLSQKYGNDSKFVRIHKRITEQNILNLTDSKLVDVLIKIKKEIDLIVIKNKNVLDNETYLELLLLSNLIKIFTDNSFDLELITIKYINHILVKEYINEHKGESL